MRTSRLASLVLAGRRGPWRGGTFERPMSGMPSAWAVRRLGLDEDVHDYDHVTCHDVQVETNNICFESIHLQRHILIDI